MSSLSALKSNKPGVEGRYVETALGNLPMVETYFGGEIHYLVLFPKWIATLIGSQVMEIKPDLIYNQFEHGGAVVKQMSMFHYDLVNSSITLQLSKFKTSSRITLEGVGNFQNDNFNKGIPTTLGPDQVPDDVFPYTSDMKTTPTERLAEYLGTYKMHYLVWGSTRTVTQFSFNSRKGYLIEFENGNTILVGHFEVNVGKRDRDLLEFLDVLEKLVEEGRPPHSIIVDANRFKGDLNPEDEELNVKFNSDLLNGLARCGYVVHDPKEPAEFISPGGSRDFNWRVKEDGKKHISKERIEQKTAGCLNVIATFSSEYEVTHFPVLLFDDDTPEEIPENFKNLSIERLINLLKVIFVELNYQFDGRVIIESMDHLNAAIAKSSTTSTTSTTT